MRPIILVRMNCLNWLDPQLLADGLESLRTSPRAQLHSGGGTLDRASVLCRAVGRIFLILAGCRVRRHAHLSRLLGQLDGMKSFRYTGTVYRKTMLPETGTVRWSQLKFRFSGTILKIIASTYIVLSSKIRQYAVDPKSLPRRRQHVPEGT